MQENNDLFFRPITVDMKGKAQMRVRIGEILFNIMLEKASDFRQTL